MELVLFRHLWGISEDWETAFPRIQAAGYAGIEAPLPAPADQSRFRALLDKYDFAYIAQIFTQGNTVAEHLDSFQTGLLASRELQPMFVNSHSGSDSMDEDQVHSFFSRALELEADMGLPVSHETHRSRILFNPWITKRLLLKFEQLRLCCDYSHWVCVCERLLETESDIFELCARHSLHLHTRVGYEQGPQVPDPRAPEYAHHLEVHEALWRMIWKAQAEQGCKLSTMTPEFGPPYYLHTYPYSNQPVADLWEICNWQARRQSMNYFDQVGA